MANGENRPRPSSYEGGDGREPLEVFLILTILAVVAGTIVERVITFASSPEPLQAFYNFVLFVWPFSIFISVLFIAGIAYCVRRLTKVNQELFLKYHTSKRILSEPPKTTGKKVGVNQRWQKVLDHLESTNISDWKLAILQADTILEDMVDKMGYKGDGLGAKLNSIEESDFSTLDKAWQAHKIRNAIAREGTSFIITQDEARRVINLYREVFEEFRYI